MNTQSKILAFATALGIALPVVTMLSTSEAHAAGGVLSSANNDGKRTHKRVGKKTSKKSTKKKSTTTRTTTTHTSNSRVVSTRTYRTSSSNTTTRRTYVRHSSRPVRVVRTSPTHVHRHTDVVYVQEAPSTARSTSTSKSSGSKVDVYITGGVGTSGFASTTITDEALPGIGWNVAVGGKGEYLGFEVGLDGGGYTFDPQGENSTDMSLFGLYGDLKLQPTLADFLEPYVYAGVGGYVLGDGILDESSSGGALRLGLGVNLRFGDFAIGGKYAWQSMAFTDDSGSYGGDFGAQTETIGINLSLYF